MTFRCLLPLATVTPKWIRRASLRNPHDSDDDGHGGDGDGDNYHGDDHDGDGNGGAYVDPAYIIAQSR